MYVKSQNTEQYTFGARNVLGVESKTGIAGRHCYDPDTRKTRQGRLRTQV